jgi:Transposase DDE domain group 1
LGRVEILLRGDSHYCTPEVLRFDRANRVDYALRFATTTTLRRHIDTLKQSTAARFPPRVLPTSSGALRNSTTAPRTGIDASNALPPASRLDPTVWAGERSARPEISEKSFAKNPPARRPCLRSFQGLALDLSKDWNVAMIGYARSASREERQVLDRHIEALTAAGCDRVFDDDGSSIWRRKPPHAAMRNDC